MCDDMSTVSEVDGRLSPCRYCGRREGDDGKPHPAHLDLGEVCARIRKGQGGELWSLKYVITCLQTLPKVWSLTQLWPSWQVSCGERLSFARGCRWLQLDSSLTRVRYRCPCMYCNCSVPGYTSSSNCAGCTVAPCPEFAFGNSVNVRVSTSPTCTSLDSPASFELCFSLFTLHATLR